jgi:hypothetical protein
MSTRHALWSVALALVWGGAGGCADDAKVGTCKVEEGKWIGPNTGYLYDRKRYCAEEAACVRHCDAVGALPHVGSCEWDSFQSCTGELPQTPPRSEVCALELLVDCGSGGTPQVSCLSCDDPPAGTSDYDPETNCLSKWSTKVGRGATCEEAEEALAE